MTEFNNIFARKYTPIFFDFVSESDPERQIRVYHEWPLFKELINPKNIDTLFHEESSEKIINKALNDLKQSQGSSLSFLHLDKLDHIGHGERWGTKAYFKGLAEIDELLGQVLKTIDSSPQLKENTVLILSADHGGERNKSFFGIINRSNHDDPSATSVRFIPWFAMGPGIEAKEIQCQDVNIKNMAASVLSILNIPQPDKESWKDNVPLL